MNHYQIHFTIMFIQLLLLKSFSDHDSYIDLADYKISIALSAIKSFAPSLLSLGPCSINQSIFIGNYTNLREFNL